MYEDIVIELARTERELTQRVERRIRQEQLGEAWDGIERRITDQKQRKGSCNAISRISD